MNVGELFVNLGVKGTDKTLGALGGVKDGLKDTASMSLEAKAGILGAMYALEQLMAASGEKGTALTNLNALLGVSTKTLQQYEYAARQVGVSNEEMDGTFKAIQSTMTKNAMGKGAPAGLALVSNLVGGLSDKDIKAATEHPEKMIQTLQKAVQEAQKKGVNTGLINEAIKSFGVGDNMISAFRRNAFRQDVFDKAPTYNEKELGALDKANIAWSNLGNKIQMAIGHFNAAHGGQLVSDISKITDKVVSLAEAFVKLSEKLKLFEWVGKAFEGWTAILGGLSTAVDKVSGAIGDPKKATSLKEEAKETASLIGQGISGMFGELLSGIMPATANGAPLPTNKLVSPTIPASAGQPINNAQTQNINVNQNLNFAHDGKDAQKTGKDVKKATQDAYRQMSAQTRSN